jgi:hypothetical protein
MAIDPLGNVSIIAAFSGSITIGGNAFSANGARDVLMASYSPAGALLWARHHGVAGQDIDAASMAIVLDINNYIWATGTFTGTTKFGNLPTMTSKGTDTWVAKFYANDGSPALSLHIGDKSGQAADTQQPRRIVVDGGGSPIVLGTFNTSISFGASSATSAGSSDLFLAKLDDTGAPVWFHAYGSTGLDMADALAVDSLGNIAFAGENIATINVGGANLPGPGGGASGAFYAMVGPNGVHQWSSRFASQATSNTGKMAFDGNGNLLIASWAPQGIDFGGGMGIGATIAKLTNAGSYLWSKAFKTTTSQPQVGINPINNRVIFHFASSISPVDAGFGPMVLPQFNTGFMISEYEP